MGLFYDIIMKRGYYEALVNVKVRKSSCKQTDSDKKTKE